jgi:cobalt/nickel transport system permease protein
MIDEPFATGSTLFHKRDPKIKIIGAAAISIVLALCTSIPVAATGCITTAILLFLSKPHFGLLSRRLLQVNIFTLFIWLTIPLTYGNGDTVHFSFLNIYFDGIRMATLISLKTNGILFCFLALLATSSTVSIGYGLEKLGVPRKLSFLFLFAYRQLFVIHQEYQRLQRAAKLRGFTPKNSVHTYQTYSHLFGMTLVKSWNRAERVHQAMILRGFNGRLIPLIQPKPGKADYLFLFIMLLISLFLTGLSFVSVSQ